MKQVIFVLMHIASCHFVKNALPYLNILKTKRVQRYIRNQSVPRSKHFSTVVIKTNQLMLYKSKVAVSFEIRTIYSTQSEHHVEFLNVKPGGT